MLLRVSSDMQCSLPQNNRCPAFRSRHQRMRRRLSVVTQSLEEQEWYGDRMRNSDWKVRQIARCLVILLVVSCGDAGLCQAQVSPAAPQQKDPPAQEGQQPANSESGSTDMIPVPAGMVEYPDAPDSQSGQTSNSQSTVEPQQSGDGKPLGTAAAPYSKPSGVTGSRPAGVAIAPAKQRRVRAIFISVGVVAAAAIAIGTVAALSHGSPSRP